MDPSPAEPAHVDVLDVLEMIPLDVVESNIWRTLTCGGCSALRQTSRRARRLVNELTTSAAYSLWGDGSRTINDVSSQEATQDSCIERWAAFLARLPRLTSVYLSQTSGSPQQQQPISDAPLVAALVHSGVATQGRVRVLRLECTALPLTTTCAARLAHPGLEELHVLPSYGDPLTTMHLHCRPWRGSALRKVVLGDWRVPDTETVVDLCGLSRLQHLEMTVGHLPDLHHLTALANLQHLSLRSTHGRPAVPVGDLACLFTLTRLTHLGLLFGLHVAADGPASDVALGAPCAALGQQRRLQSLHLCHNFVVHNSLFAGLALLSQLTELNIDRMELTGWRDGHLPLLQKLTLNGPRPTSMLQALTPLLPLPSLTHCTASFFHPRVMIPSNWADSCVALDVRTVDSTDAAAQAGALKLAAKHLAAAPRLRVRTLLLGLYDPKRRPGPPMLGQLSVTQLAEGLRPLGSTLQRLHLVGLSLDDQGWAELAAAVPRLERLTVMFGSLTDAGLAAIGRHLSSLSVLDFRRYVEAQSPSDDAWLGLARARSGPLQISASVSEQVQARCAVEQERAHGRASLTWCF